MSRAAPGRGVVAALVVVALTGCHRREVPLGLALRDAGPPVTHAAVAAGPEVVVLERVAIRSGEGGEVHELYDDELAKTFGRELSAAPGFVAAAAPPPAGVRVRRARAELVVTIDSSGGPAGKPIYVAVEATLRWSDPSDEIAPSDRVLVEGRLPRGADLDGVLAALAGDAVTRAAGGVAARQALRCASDAAVIAELGSEDPDRLRWALIVAGERRLAAAVDAVAALLAAHDPGIAGAAISALVAIGDRRAVPALTSDVDFKDYERLRTLIEAAVALGGADAVEFLEFVESGHPDPDIKERASEGLERLRRR